MSEDDLTRILGLVEGMLTEEERASLDQMRAETEALSVRLTAHDSSAPLTADDLRQIEVEASVRYHRAYYCDAHQGPEDAAQIALMFGCQEWGRAKLSGHLFRPVADSDEPAFAANLLRQMARHSQNPQAKTFLMMSGMCADLADALIDPTVDVAHSSFLAGLLLGQLGEARVSSMAAIIKKQLDARMQADKDARGKWQAAMSQKATEREAKILDFAAAHIKANPFISDRQIQKLYREKVRRPADTSSNAEAKIIARLRASGRLPPRQR